MINESQLDNEMLVLTANECEVVVGGSVCSTVSPVAVGALKGAIAGFEAGGVVGALGGALAGAIGGALFTL